MLFGLYQKATTILVVAGDLLKLTSHGILNKARGFPEAAKENRSAAFGKDGLEHQIRNEENFVKHVDYIHFNPVKGFLFKPGQVLLNPMSRPLSHRERVGVRGSKKRFAIFNCPVLSG
jgi:hypothetical protein